MKIASMKYVTWFMLLLFQYIQQYLCNTTLPGFIIKANKYFKQEYHIYKNNLIIQSRLAKTLKHLIYTFSLKGKKVYLEMASLKNPTSFRRKLLFKRDKNIDLMDDIVRASIVFEDLETLYQFKNKLKQIYLVRDVSDNFNPKKYYKAFFYKMTDLLSDAKNMFEVQLQLCQSYFVHKYTHNFYKIVRNIDHIIKHGDSNTMNLKIDISILENSYNPYPYFIIKRLQKNYHFHQLTGKEILLREIKILVKSQLKLAQTKNCLKKYTFLFAFMKEQYHKLKDSKFHITKLEEFFKFMKLLTTKIYANANENYLAKIKCDFS